jgi:DNA-binding transcriptional LysR family regulator
MDTRLLETLFAIRDAGSIAGAARKLNVSTAAVAERIHLLEDELGARLVVRSGRTVSLTPAGANILPYAEEIIRRVKELPRRAHPDKIQGQLAIGAVASILARLFPGVLQRATREYPDLDLVVVPGTSSHLFDRVTRGELSCAVIGKPPFDLGKAFNWTTLRREYLVLMSRWDDPVEPVETVLATRPLIRVDTSAWTGQVVSQYLRDVGIEVKVILELDAFEATRHLIARGVGVSVQPDSGFPDGPVTGLRKTRIDSDKYVREMGLVSRATGGEQMLISTMLAMLKDETAEQDRLLAEHERRRERS